MQNKDLARENERASEIAADLASQMIGGNHAPIEGMKFFFICFVFEFGFLFKKNHFSIFSKSMRKNPLWCRKNL